MDLLQAPAGSPSEPCPASQWAPREDEEDCQTRNMQQNTENRSHRSVNDVFLEFLTLPGQVGRQSGQVEDEGKSLQHAESLRCFWLIRVQKHEEFLQATVGRSPNLTENTHVHHTDSADRKTKMVSLDVLTKNNKASNQCVNRSL